MYITSQCTLRAEMCMSGIWANSIGILQCRKSWDNLQLAKLLHSESLCTELHLDPGDRVHASCKSGATAAYVMLPHMRSAHWPSLLPHNLFVLPCQLAVNLHPSIGPACHGTLADHVIHLEMI